MVDISEKSYVFFNDKVGSSALIYDRGEDHFWEYVKDNNMMAELFLQENPDPRGMWTILDIWDITANERKIEMTKISEDHRANNDVLYQYILYYVQEINREHSIHLHLFSSDYFRVFRDVYYDNGVWKTWKGGAKSKSVFRRD